MSTLNGHFNYIKMQAIFVTSNLIMDFLSHHEDFAKDTHMTFTQTQQKIIIFCVPVFFVFLFVFRVSRGIITGIEYRFFFLNSNIESKLKNLASQQRNYLLR